MTTQELNDRVKRIAPSGHGTWKVTIKYRGKEYSAYTHNSLAIDRLSNDGMPSNQNDYGYTYKQALQTIYDEVVKYHDLGR